MEMGMGMRSQLESATFCYTNIESEENKIPASIIFYLIKSYLIKNLISTA